MNARAEAHARLGGRYEVRVLEPSPPAVAAPPWFADDPVARGELPAGHELVSPIVGGGDLTWDALADDDLQLADWCAARWLGAYRRLGPAPAALVATRLALHQLAERVLSPARQKANGKIGLRFTRGGFGTPFFAEDVQLRVEGAQLVVQTRAGERCAPISTLAAAADAVGGALLPDALDVDDGPLDVELLAAEDQREVGLRFFRARLRALTS